MKPLARRLRDLRATTGHHAPAQTTKPAIARALRMIALLCALAILVLGIVVLVAWLRNYEPAMPVISGHTRMKANTAFLFIISALALLLILNRRQALRPFAIACAVIIFVIALLSLTQYPLHVDLRIDQLLTNDLSRNPHPGRMAPVTAANFLITAGALFLLTGTLVQRRIAHGLGLCLSAISIACVVGFLYGVGPFYGSGNYTSMAFSTGIGFIILSFGLVLAPLESPTAHMLAAAGTSGWLVRRALPAIILLPILLGWVYLQSLHEMTSLRLGMAVFVVSLVGAAVAGLWLITLFLARAERQRNEIDNIREQAAYAVRQSEHELRVVTDQLPTLISYIDPEGRFLRVNQTYERWTGLSQHQIIGHTILELFGADYWQSTATERLRALAGETVTFETLYPGSPDRSATPRRVQITYVPDIDHGSVRGLICMVLDVEDQRRAEASIRQSEKLAVVGRLASSIAHEINNPLEAVTNLLYLTEQDSPPGSTARSYTQLAQQELSRVTHIVTQTLRFHRQSHHPVQCSLTEITEQVLVLYHGRLEQAQVAIERRFRATEPILCRDGEIRQVLANLIGNSAEAMAANCAGTDPRPRRLLIRTRPATCAKTGTTGIRVTVADTGHGIKVETRKTLFQPFHTTKGATGSGLGLWVSKEIVDRHGGRIHVRSSTHPKRHHTVFAIFLAHQQDIPTT